MEAIFTKAGWKTRIGLMFIIPFAYLCLIVVVGILGEAGYLSQIPLGILLIVGGISMFTPRYSSDGLWILGVISLMIGILILGTGGHLRGLDL